MRVNREKERKKHTIFNLIERRLSIQQREKAGRILKKEKTAKI